MRVRVCLDVTKPLKKTFKLKQEGGAWKEVTLKYERLLTFCFSYGKIGHGEKFCTRQFENEEGIIERKFGPKLRVMPRRSSQFTMGSRWLLQAPVLMEEKDGGHESRAEN